MCVCVFGLTQTCTCTYTVIEQQSQNVHYQHKQRCCLVTSFTALSSLPLIGPRLHHAFLRLRPLSCRGNRVDSGHGISKGWIRVSHYMHVGGERGREGDGRGMGGGGEVERETASQLLKWFS